MVSFEFDSSAIDDLMGEINRFEIECPECEHSFEVSINDIGETVECPHCGLVILLESE